MYHVYHLKTLPVVMNLKKKDSEDKKFHSYSKPYATVAIEINEDGTVNRGISICSPKDQFVKKEGCNKAIGRLMAAKVHEQNISPIVAFKKMEKKILRHYKDILNPAQPKYKVDFKFLGYYRDEPLEAEKTIFKEEFKKVLGDKFK